MENPRYPHQIKITRENATSQFEDDSDTPDEIYNGEGRCFKTIRSYASSGVVMSDFTVSIPTNELVFMMGDIVEATIPSNGDVIRGKINSRPVTANFGTHLYFNNTGK